MADTVVTIGADLTALRRDLAKLPNLSGEAAQKTLINVERVVVKAEKAAKNATKKIAAANRKAARESKNAWKGVGQSLSALGPAAGIATMGIAAIPAVALAAATAIFKLADGMSQFVDQTQQAAFAAGVTVPEFLALTHAAALAGGTVKDLEPGLRKLVGTMGDARDGTKTAVDAFERLGIEFQNTDGTLRSANDVLAESLDAIGKLSTETERAAAAQDVFGARGAKVVAMLGDNSDALVGAMDSTAGLAQAVGDAQGASEQMDKSLAELNVTLKELKVRTGADLTDSVSGTIDALAELVDQFIQFRKHTEWIRDITQWRYPLRRDGTGRGDRRSRRGRQRRRRRVGDPQSRRRHPRLIRRNGR